ncbi:MAG: glycosyltransferase [Halobellus sp.]|uniref:glycosyltransferase n=1 Tax=Halobellus sp. TaxID=1979212 RepID=UPI0035D5283D
MICGTETDPIARRDGDLPESAQVVAAGDPVGCSGKANAIAAGVEALQHDRLVEMDDDFHYPADWLAQLHADDDRHGPVSELPYFVGQDPLSRPLDPIYASGGTLGIYANDKSWAGAVIFDRSDIDCDAFVRELRQTASDDGLLSESLDVKPLRRTRTVPVSGTIRETLERHLRFIRIVYRHEPFEALTGIVVTAGFAAVGLAFPLVAFVGVACMHAAINEFLGVRRWTAVFGFPAVLATLPLFGYGLVRQTFVCGVVATAGARCSTWK